MKQFVICPICKEVRIWEEVLAEVESMGSPGMCMCEYMETYINEDGEEETDFPRILHEYQSLETYMKTGRFILEPLEYKELDEDDENGEN